VSNIVIIIMNCIPIVLWIVVILMG